MASILDINSDASDSDDENYVPNRTGDTSDSCSGEEEEEEDDHEGNRSSRKNGPSNGESGKKPEEKPEETEEERKKRENEIFKKFMEEVAEDSRVPPKPDKNDDAKSVVSGEVKKVTVTEEYEFAGESVKVTKEVPAGESTISAPSQGGPPGRAAPAKRSGGLTSIMGILDKKKQKLSTLEKSRLDWNSFKEKEGIDEELQQHNRGKGGYLERKAFLERSDLKQFEIERNLRMTGRRK